MPAKSADTAAAAAPVTETTTDAATAAATGEQPAAAATTKVRKKRTASAPKPVYAVVQVLNANGDPIAIEKGQVKLVSFEKSAEKVLEIVESGSVPNALYLRGMMPAGR